MPSIPKQKKSARKKEVFLTLDQFRKKYFPNLKDCPYCNGTGIDCRNTGRWLPARGK